MPSTNTRNVVLRAVLACLIIAGAVSAFAIPTKQVARSLTAKTVTAKCCVLFGPAVSITEPTAVAPVIVTWNSDYSINDEFRIGLSLNGGSCLSYGSGVGPLLTIPGSGFQAVTYQWVLFPGDGLLKGNNTFQVCGGGANSDAAAITIGNNTLTVQISK
ncbi:MAG: hypothetical protein HY010_12685 [Acidobacteria bacterium]|nr:hypothetical protein [Acidobacteriota bacterium]